MTAPPPLARTRALAPLAILILWTLVCLPALAEDPRDPGKFFFDQTFGDFSEELANARSQGKQGILLMFEMDECPFCHRMKTTVLNRPDIQEYFKKHFLIFPVDIEGDVEIADFAGQTKPQKDFALKDYRVRATPVFAFFDLDGKLIQKYIGATRDAQEFMWLGEYMVQGRYKDTPFPRYKREREREAATVKTGAPG